MSDFYDAQFLNGDFEEQSQPRCPNAGHPCNCTGACKPDYVPERDRTWFDRTICPEPCGGMHDRDVATGKAVGGCPLEDGFTQAGETFADFVLALSEERARQDDKFGEQHHPDGTSAKLYEMQMWAHKRRANHHARLGTLTWKHIFLEEVYEALCETEPKYLKAELIQCAAVILAWIEDIESRESK